MMYMKKMRCLLQREQGVVLLPFAKKKPKTISGELNPEIVKQNLMGKTGAIEDGRWITIQEWSMCTLKCGGGQSYFQRMCVPPKNGGKPCMGEAILTKKCNEQPCPDFGVAKNPKDNTIVQKTNKPIVKIMPFSSKPQRYTKCVIKESDMMYTKSMSKKDSTTTGPVDKDSTETMQIPVRVIMNNRTVTIYAGDDIDTHLDAFNIASSSFMNEEVKEGASPSSCFFIKSADGREAHLCPFGCANGDTKIVDEWRYDYNLFKFQCNHGHKEQELDMSLQRKLEAKIGDAKAALIAEAQMDVKKKAQISEEQKLQATVREVNTVALSAIQKEINVEELIKNEEKEREIKEEEEFQLKIVQEQEKQVNYL